MSQEVEAKFRLANLPPIDEENKGKEIRQGYLDFKSDIVVQDNIKSVFGDIDLSAIKEARVRAKGSGEKTKYFFTLKSDGTLQRDEFEEEVDQSIFETLWAETKLGKVSKVRREMDLGSGLIAEVDEYKDNLEGLFSLEIEFDPFQHELGEVQAAVSSLDASAEDVTEIKAYKNREMALRGSLGELEEAVKAEKEAKIAEASAGLKLS